MNNKVTINRTTGNIVCINEVVQQQLAVGSIVGKNGGPLNVNSDMIVNGKTQFNQNVQAVAGISSGSVPIWISQDDLDLGGGTLVIDTSGLYQLSESIEGSISVIANDVSINMSNQTITPGENTPLYGIQVLGNNFKGWDGTIKGFECGVWIEGTNISSLQNINVLNTIVPSVMSMGQLKLVPNTISNTVPEKFATGPVKVQPRAVPTLKNGTKPNYKPSDSAKAAKAAFPKQTLTKHTTPDAPLAPRINTSENNSEKVHDTYVHWRDSLTDINVLLNPLLKTAPKQTAVSKEFNQRTWIGPHNGVPFAGIYISNCYNVSLNGIVCDASAEVGIVLNDVTGFTIQNITISNGNRGMTITNSKAGFVNNINLTGNTDTSSYDNSAILDFTECKDIQCSNMSVTSNYKGVYANQFDNYSGIVSLLECYNVNIVNSTFSTNASIYFSEDFSTFSVLLVLNCDNCTFKNCNMDNNYRNNDEMSGGYLYTCACRYNTNIIFDNCTASRNNIYNAGSCELTGWFCLGNTDLKFKNCDATALYTDGTIYGSYVQSFIFVYTTGLTIENCKAAELENSSNDNTGYITHLGLYSGCDGAVVSGFICDGNNGGCDSNNYGIDVFGSYVLRFKNCSVSQLNSNSQIAIGFRFSQTNDTSLDGCISTQNYGDAFGTGFYFENCYTCVVTNCIGSDNGGNGFETASNCQQCTFQNNKANNNSYCGFLDDSYASSAWFANTAANNDTNFALYGNGNTYIFFSDVVASSNNPWQAPGWVGAPITPGSWDNIDIRYD